MDIPLGGFSCPLFPDRIEIWNVGFCAGRKTLGARTTTNNKLNPRVTPGPGIEPGPQWWEASAPTTAPSLLLIDYDKHFCEII